jgi:hypothetical protein
LLETALLDVRVLPWRIRARVMKPSTLRENLDPTLVADDFSGLLLGLAVWLVIIIAAPVVVLVLAAGLLSIELPVLIVLALVLLLIRFTGLLPWTVLVLDPVSGAEHRERYRSLWRAVRRIRAINSDRRVKVRWAWT